MNHPLISECEMQQIIQFFFLSMKRNKIFLPSLGAANDEVLVIELMALFRYELESHARKIFGDEKFSTLSFEKQRFLFNLKVDL